MNFTTSFLSALKYSISKSRDLEELSDLFSSNNTVNKGFSNSFNTTHVKTANAKPLKPFSDLETCAQTISIQLSPIKSTETVQIPNIKINALSLNSYLSEDLKLSSAKSTSSTDEPMIDRKTSEISTNLSVLSSKSSASSEFKVIEKENGSIYVRILCNKSQPVLLKYFNVFNFK